VPAEAKPSGNAQEYTIKAGDTLTKLATQFYGAGDKWRKIYEANSQTIKNPDYIFVGQKIMIPS
jgi:nucleoid-associated protein YgaU